MNSRPTIPTKREFPSEDRDRPFGTAPKAPKLDNYTSATEASRQEATKSTSPSAVRQTVNPDTGRDRDRASPTEARKDGPSNLTQIQTQRDTDVPMTDASPRTEKPPVSAASSAPEVLQDSDDDLDLDDADFAESEAKYNREKALLEAKRIDLSAPHLRATTPLSEIMLLASLTIDHLPRQDTKSVDEEMASVPPLQPPAEVIAAELPTPKAEEETGDVVMEDENEKGERPLAPATRALRLRQGDGDDTDEEPDYSSLPYLGSGPPTPISQLEGPRMDESVMLAIRDKLKATIEPELSPEETLQQYANIYRQWRLKIRELDDTKDHDDPERQPSAEPSVRVTTPDAASAAMGPLLDLPPTTSGRRGHGSRWATELDLETAIKESLKTAEEERMGKKDREPTRSMADPEKEATLPLQLTTYEVQRRRFIDTNFQREPGQGLFVFHYEPPEDDFTEEEHKIMVQQYKDQYSKKWGKLAEMLYKEAGTSRTYKDCINHYYATKWGREYKGKLKRGRGARKRGGGAGRRGAISNMGDRPDPSGDDGLPPALTETGRPRRSAAPTFGGAETDLDTTTSTPTSGRLRRPTDADGTQEKVGRKKAPKEKGGRKAKAQPLVAAAPVGSPVKSDRKVMNVKMEDEQVHRHALGEMLPMQPALDEAMNIVTEPQYHPGQTLTVPEKPRAQPNSRPGPSSYWSVTEQADFRKYVAHFGTNWVAIAQHMGTKTQTMVKNQYLRIMENGQDPELERFANEADARRGRGEDVGPPPTPTPASKRRYESTQVAAPRTLAPTPEATIPPAMALAKASPPGSASSSRYSNIAQAPQEVKPVVPAPGYPITDSGPPSIPSQPQLPPQTQQSPPGQPPRGPGHQFQHVSQPETRRPPPVGYFSQQDFPPRRDHRPSSQSSNAPQNARPLQPQVQSQLRAQEPSQTPFYRPTPQERESASRLEHQQQQSQQDHDARMRYHAQHGRRISGEVAATHSRHLPSTVTPVPQMRAAQSAGSPEHHPVSSQHRVMPQQQPDAPVQPPISLPPTQHLPPRSAMETPPLKEETRVYPVPHIPQTQQPLPPPTPSQGYPPLAQPPPQTAPPPPAPKPASEPRKSNLLSLLNDPEPEEPRRKKPVEQNVPSHTPTPQQQMPIAPPPPVSQALPPQRDPYRDPATSQPPYGRSFPGQQSVLPQMASGRQVVDLTNEQVSAGRGLPRESWRQSYSGQSQHQPVPAHNSPHAGLAQLANHRSVFAQHNAPRYNPSPPPLATYNNSPHLHSRTPSISGAPTQPPRHSMTPSTSVPHAQGITSQSLQPNPYAQVDPPGSGAQPPGPVGMQPSPHMHMSHVASQRELHSRNEQSRGHNAAIGYSNTATSGEHHSMPQHMRGPSMADPYRRDPRDIHHDFDARNPERDMSRELAHRGDALRESYHLSRPAGPPQSHADARYQAPQDRGYLPPRAQTHLSRSEHGPPPTLQHPPHSSLGESNHALYGQRQEEPIHRFREAYPLDARISERMQEQAQQHQPGRDDPFAREREMREREMRDRDMREREAREREMQEAQYHRDSMMRRPGPPPQGHDQRGGPPTQPMDWSRHPPPQQQERWNR
ncbi:hypothetical protein DM02DRAFT_512103 [Periconia macrospinosa]|uniref:Myb-like domain-containing protein n=1 Tax=Periconia macrospinosa TaxID=97972 RepID=A0A2V1EAJ6_9PLEO|nr:hypothetical protein DM02DRAFT_512103 [Periconia macrospinosa]